MRQPDLFDTDPQDDLFDEDRPEMKVSADPDKVRAQLLAVLAQAKAASTMPWTAEKLGFWKLVFPQMSNWLPPEEKAQLCFEFETEVKRLEAA